MILIQRIIQLNNCTFLGRGTRDKRFSIISQMIIMNAEISRDKKRGIESYENRTTKIAFSDLFNEFSIFLNLLFL